MPLNAEEQAVSSRVEMDVTGVGVLFLCLLFECTVSTQFTSLKKKSLLRLSVGHIIMLVSCIAQQLQDVQKDVLSIL